MTIKSNIIFLNFCFIKKIFLVNLFGLQRKVNYQERKNWALFEYIAEV